MTVLSGDMPRLLTCETSNGSFSTRVVTSRLGAKSLCELDLASMRMRLRRSGAPTIASSPVFETEAAHLVSPMGFRSTCAPKRCALKFGSMKAIMSATWLPGQLMILTRASDGERVCVPLWSCFLLDVKSGMLTRTTYPDDEKMACVLVSEGRF